jgi:hypothetical protein
LDAWLAWLNGLVSRPWCAMLEKFQRWMQDR